MEYQFNDHGNLVAVRDELGYAAYATYGEELPNHADKTSRLQRTVVNTLRNHSFETADHWTTSLEDGAAGTHSFATDQRMMGSKAAKMVRTNADGAMRISQNVEVTAGRTYTLSCYMKTSASAVKCMAMTFLVSSATMDGFWYYGDLIGLLGFAVILVCGYINWMSSYYMGTFSNSTHTSFHSTGTVTRSVDELTSLLTNATTIEATVKQNSFDDEYYFAFRSITRTGSNIMILGEPLTQEEAKSVL